MELDGSTPEFWTDVSMAFKDETKYGEILFDGDEFSSINPSNFKKHFGAKKLQAMWKEMNKNYKAALSKYRLSGQHDPDFCDIAKRLEDGEDDFQSKSHRY